MTINKSRQRLLLEEAQRTKKKRTYKVSGFKHWGTWTWSSPMKVECCLWMECGN